MLVGERVDDGFRLGHSGEDLVGHFIHGVLDTGALVLGEELECDLARNLPGAIELGEDVANGLDAGKRLPLPAGIHISGKDAVPCLGQRGVLVAHKAVKCRARALEHCEAGDGAGQGDAVLAADAGLDVALLLAVLDEAVGVGLAIDVEARPAVGGDLDIGHVDVAVLFNEMASQDGGEELRGGDGILLGEDECGVFDGVGGDDDAVVGLGVGCVNVALEEAADGHLGDGVDAGGGIAVRLEDADIVLAIPGGGYVRHDYLGR